MKFVVYLVNDYKIQTVQLETELDKIQLQEIMLEQSGSQAESTPNGGGEEVMWWA